MEFKTFHVFPLYMGGYVDSGDDPGRSLFPNGWYNLLCPSIDSSAMSTVP